MHLRGRQWEYSSLIVDTLPPDRSPNGGGGAVIMETQSRNKARVRARLRSGCPTLYSLVSEIVGEVTSEKITHSPFLFVIISRCRDKIYLCMANVPLEARSALLCSCSVVGHAWSVLLHTIYGIDLKWEPHGDR